MLALVLAAIGNGFAKAHYHGVHPNTTAVKVDEAVANGTVHVLGSIVSLPFLITGMFLALIAILLTLIRIRKVKAEGLAVSIFWILISVWALRLVFSALNLLKAH